MVESTPYAVTLVIYYWCFGYFGKHMSKCSYVNIIVYLSVCEADRGFYKDVLMVYCGYNGDLGLIEGLMWLVWVVVFG